MQQINLKIQKEIVQKTKSPNKKTKKKKKRTDKKPRNILITTLSPHASPNKERATKNPILKN